ncbi:MAG: YebC/PmpR family DNA-binding transcriptional regulator [Chloroflexi bacterium]|nr:MAG: YebC/PmpR family DNA-binding transcriptional regulator [Chloroflexota bacterium]
MSGHSKWSTIKRKKGAEDAKRGKIFTRLARDITLAARSGGGDENANPKLKLAIQKAKAANMPKDNIERAIKRGTGEIDGGDMEELVYEGYGPEGVAFIVEALTDNKNRTLAEVKHAFSKGGGNLASAGSVLWQFDQKGFIQLKGEGLDFEEVFMIAAEAGADDVVQEEGIIIVYTPRELFAAVEQALTEAGLEIEDSGLRWIPQNEQEVSADAALKNMKLMERLEELDDVQSVSSNLAITDEAIAAFES